MQKTTYSSTELLNHLKSLTPSERVRAFRSAVEHTGGQWLEVDEVAFSGLREVSYGGISGIGQDSVEAIEDWTEKVEKT